MESRIQNPAIILPDAVSPIQGLYRVAEQAVTPALMHLIHLRASQINGCSFCVFNANQAMRKAGETDDRIAAVAAWRHSPLFSDAERALLALTEAETRIADREDPVPDAVWNEAKRHFDERQLAGIVLGIAAVNVFNRVNVATAQVARAWG
ncbi:MAG TPA: carboxymuconolactone decarboxylase family protein [Kofleriaceae bacterium]